MPLTSRFFTSGVVFDEFAARSSLRLGENQTNGQLALAFGAHPKLFTNRFGAYQPILIAKKMLAAHSRIAGG